MSGWHSLQSVGTFHTLLQIAGVLVAAVTIAAGATAYHFRDRWHELVAIAERARQRYAPRWRIDDTSAALHNAFAEVAILGIAALLATGYAAHQYGARKSALIAMAHSAGLDQARGETATLRRALADSEARSAAELAALREEQEQARERHDAEVAVLRDEQEQAGERHEAEISILRNALELAQPRSTEGSRRSGGEAEARLAAEVETLRRANDLATARHGAEIAELRSRLNQAETRRVTLVESLRWEVKQTEQQAAAEIGRLQQQLSNAERKLATLQARRRLSIEEKHALIDALSPYAGQRVIISAIAGDEDGKAYAEDFVEVFEAAGWEHPKVSYGRWDRDPVGVEITLNEADGRAGRVNTGIGALINVARRLSLVDGNTIYMTAEVPVGQVQLKIGRKLER